MSRYPRNSLCIPLLPLVFLFSSLSATPASSVNPAFQPLQKYEGSWQVTRHFENGQNGKTQRFVNRCAALGIYFACEQSVDKEASALLVFIPAGQPGHYHTQSILPGGRATGLDELQLSDDRWVFTSRRHLGGNTTYYRNTNIFVDKDHIHFENAQSPDGKKWTTQQSGDEIRLSR